MQNDEDRIIIFEAPKIEPPEFRLYYDDQGKVLFYSCDKNDTGNFIIIDRQTFAECRPDIRIIDGQISRVSPNAVVHKYMQNESEGVSCHPDDVSILVGDKYDGKVQKWKLTTYELK